MKFNVTFCRNNYVNTLNPDDAVAVTVEANSFNKAREIARREVNEMDCISKNGWKWESTTIIV